MSSARPVITVITADGGSIRHALSEIIRYRELLFVLAYRDYRVRYAQTLLGFFWAFLQPAATLLVFSLIFGRAVAIDTGDVPYPLFAATGLATWMYFAYVLSQSGTSIIGAQDMIKKIYFPRLLIPLSKAVVGFVDFAIAVGLLLILILYYEAQIGSNAVLVLAFALAGIVIALAAGVWISALTVRYRDFQHMIPFLVQVGLYVTPIAYPATMVTDVLPHWASVLYYLNPMVGTMEGLRWALLGTVPPDALAAVSISAAVVLLLGGLVYFLRVERNMADLL